jgi:hypothetical protein
MAGSVGRVLFVILLLHSASCADQGTGQKRELATQPSWALEVLTFESAAPTALWVGLINRMGEPRLVCVFSRGILFSDKGGRVRVESEGGSPHACYVPDQFQLLREGETQFTWLTLPEGLAATVSGPIRLQLHIVSRPVMGGTSLREEAEVTWEGTLQEAADLGRGLADAARKSN